MRSTLILVIFITNLSAAQNRVLYVRTIDYDNYYDNLILIDSVGNKTTIHGNSLMYHVETRKHQYKFRHLRFADSGLLIRNEFIFYDSIIALRSNFIHKAANGLIGLNSLIYVGLGGYFMVDGDADDQAAGAYTFAIGITGMYFGIKELLQPRWYKLADYDLYLKNKNSWRQ